MKSQSDIALENQQATEKVNKREARDENGTEDDLATRFDGSSEQPDAGGVLKPKDDTPWRLEKKEQPKK